MSIWASRRRRAVQSTPRTDPRDEMEVRVARRICGMTYAKSCKCKGHTNGHLNVCDTMRKAAQAAIDEILNGTPGDV